MSFKLVPRAFPLEIGRGALGTRLGSLSNDDVNENGKKAKGFRIGKTTALHVHHAFLYISLQSLQDHNVKMPNFTFYGVCEN